ncbi:hypothetical protein NOR_05358 [Metarhizium rileyi]|uniref:Uncharacterized protein n=1 Tax=Metarhizium rileyi (strain RCEF 4871) TaxID=1649241 RepID=A0A167CJX0_METRR|nr:hypothetical protein NOR_05358 [Metarhizium rileyi RCEF 4871]TWU74031.1 hypothetical protein ED733_002020 [Metarhizium rileyi]
MTDRTDPPHVLDDMDMPSTTPGPTEPSTMSRMTRPGRNSLYDIVRRNPNIKLFVRPILWTDLHSKLLGAQFHELPPCNFPLPQNIPGSPPSKGHLHPSRAIRTLSSALTHIVESTGEDAFESANAITTVLSTLWPAAFCQPRILSPMPFFIGDRAYYDPVCTDVTWHYPDKNVPSLETSPESSCMSITTQPADSYDLFSSSASAPHDPAGLPMMCYVGKNQLAVRRKSLFRISPRLADYPNESLQRLMQLQLKTILPANSDHDAHLVAIFLAMAQPHFYRLSLSSMLNFPSIRRGMLRRPGFEEIKLRILTHDSETGEFIVYTGHITSKFLERFYDPFTAPSSEEGEDGVQGIKIDYSRVPIWPILGLRERLGLGLGEEIVGPFDPSEMETWEHDPEDPELTGAKRKREFSSDVLNGGLFDGSFGKETDNDEKRPLKKQSSREGSPTGVGA